MVDRLPGTYPGRTINNITPFTYRDGYTYLERLEYLARKINDVVDKINEVIQWVKEEITKLYDYIDDRVAELYAYIDKRVAELNKRIDDLTTRVDQIDARVKNLEQWAQGVDQWITEMNNWRTDINNWRQAVDKDRALLNKIIQNLIASGAWEDDGFKPGRNIATGNINLFGGTPDGSSFIRTNSGSSNNDIAAGI